MTHPTDSSGPSKHKPAKPYADFPLTPRADGRWMKRVYGKLRYFTGSAEQALAQYERLLEEIEPPAAADPQIRDLCEAFMCAKDADRAAGQLTLCTFKQYHRACQVVVSHFGRLRPLRSLTRQDAESLRERLCRGVGAQSQLDAITQTRVVFKWGFDQEVLGVPFHLWIRGVDKRVMKRYRATRPRRTFSAEEIRQLLDQANPQLRAMILLAINCGFGNTDVADLTEQWLDLDGGWHHFPRPKTGESRRGKLWPETVVALRLVLSQRPRPKNVADAQRVFITRQRTPYINEARDAAAVSNVFRVLLRRVGITRPGASFYTLRHVHETIGGGCCDQVAVNLSMGHADPSMAAKYRDHVADARMVDLADHIHRWLFGTPMHEPGANGFRVVG